MTDQETIAWVTNAAQRNQLFERRVEPRQQLDGNNRGRDLEADYLDEAARVMIPGRQFSVARDDAGLRLVLH